MTSAWLRCTARVRVQLRCPARVANGAVRRYGTLNQPEECPLSRTRNIGIIAHIDAGKTTTTERMLYYSGYTRRIGDVDDGSTVTDFLPAERARGITIQSAAISFHWPPVSADTMVNGHSSHATEATAEHAKLPRSMTTHQVNLIDTPGHADFTFEVLRSLRVLDGAVCILDGVAGVEAQTEMVWRQADQYRIPRLVFVNKLDRDGAAFGRTVRHIAARLRGIPAVCQIPWWENRNGTLVGVGDVIGLRGLLWQTGGDGKNIKALELADLQAEHPKLADELVKARVALVELLSNHDENLVEKFFENDENHLGIPAGDILASLRRLITMEPQQVIPVFAGASFRNIGVQPLLDAVIDLLPAPDERPEVDITLDGTSTGLQTLLNGTGSSKFVIKPDKTKAQQATPVPRRVSTLASKLSACALAFKVVNDPKRGVLVYVRVYHGSITKMAPLYNTNLKVTEKSPQLLKMYASDAVQVDAIPTGQIGVIVGLKHARTGDTLISFGAAGSKSHPPAPMDTLQLRPINVPPPVFFAGLEPNSLSEEKALSQSLELLLREDPSLNVTHDPDSGQTLLSGMGELHLEIARDRLINDFKAKATMGKIDIGYREAISCKSAAHTIVIDREIAGKKTHAGCEASVVPLDEASEVDDMSQREVFDLESNRLVIRHPSLKKDGRPISSDYKSLPPSLSLNTVKNSIRAGVLSALALGPVHHYPLHSVLVEVELSPETHIFSDTTPLGISNATRQAVRTALRDAAAQAETVLMEPLMLVTMTVNETDLGDVVHDLTSARGGQVVSLETDDATSESASSTASSLVIDPRKVYAPPDLYDAGSGLDSVLVSSAGDRQRQIVARVPCKEMVGYLKRLRSLTGGRGTFVMTVDRFERMNGARQKAVLAELRGTAI